MDWLKKLLIWIFYFYQSSAYIPEPFLKILDWMPQLLENSKNSALFMCSSILRRKFPFIQKKGKTPIFLSSHKLKLKKFSVKWNQIKVLSKNSKLNCKIFFGMLTTLFNMKKREFLDFLMAGASSLETSETALVHCKPIPVMKTGFYLWTFSHREKPVFLLQGTLFSLQGSL